MFSLHLTAAENEALAHLQTIILNPQPNLSFEQYLLNCNTAIQRYLNAHICTYSFPHSTALTHVIRDIPLWKLRTYYTLFADLDKRFNVLEKHVALGVWSRHHVFGVSYRAFQNTVYYNDFVKPIRAYNATGITLSTPHVPNVTHIFTSSEPLKQAQQDRRLALLHLIYPVFKASTLNYHHTTPALRNNARLLDCLPLKAFLFSLNGHTLHRSQALQTLLRNTPDASLLTTHAQRMPAALNALLRQQTPLLATKTTQRLRTGSNRYELTASFIPAGVLASDPCVIVLLREAQTAKPDHHDLQERWALTPREAEVALLLCERLSNREIGERLSISAHTVRHHVESILTKLGLTSRNDVLDELLHS